MKKSFLLSILWISILPVFGQFKLICEIDRDGTTLKPTNIDSIQISIQTQGENHWRSVSDNTIDLQYPHGNYQLKLIEYINGKKDSTKFEFHAKQGVQQIRLNIEVAVNLSSTMSMVNGVVSNNIDTTYVNQISLLQLESTPKDLKIKPIKGNNAKFLVNNKTSQAIYGFGDSTMIYGTLFQKTIEGWQYRDWDISMLGTHYAYCIEPGESHIAGTFEMQENKDDNIPVDNAYYSLFLFVEPMDLSFKTIGCEGEANKVKSWTDLIKPDFDKRPDGENLIKFEWRLQTATFMEYSHEF